MFQEIDPGRDILHLFTPRVFHAKDLREQLQLSSIASIALLFMLLDLYVHPHGGISYEPHRRALPDFIGPYVGNAVISGSLMTGAVLTRELLKRIGNPIADEIGHQLVILATASMIFFNVDIEQATPNNDREAFRDAAVGITTGGATSLSLALAFAKSSASLRPQVGDSADAIFG